MFSSRAKQFEELVPGTVIHDRKNKTLNKVLAVISPGIYVLSRNNDFERAEEIFTAMELVVDFNAVVVEGETLSKLLIKYGEGS